MLKLASWNVNSLKVRLEQVLDWLEKTGTDILSLQETKLVDENFPAASFEELGYHVVFSGQKTYNGVAVISRHAISQVQTDIPDLEDPQRRILAVSSNGLRIVNLYVPNGAALDSEKYPYKLSWLESVRAYLEQQLKCYPKLVVMGDFNIAPEDIDVHDPQEWAGKILCSPPERDALSNIMKLGFTDSYRVIHPQTQCFSWWDYRAAGFRRNRGLRIDLILLSEALQSACVEANIDAEPRRSERPSDHAPVFVGLNDSIQEID